LTIDKDLIAQEIKHEHSRLVARIAGILAKKVKFSDDETKLIEYAAMLHDIGKEYVPKDILQKPSKLTEEEYKIIQSHVLAGNQYILRKIKLLFAALITALQHHERIDGKGYAEVTNIHAYAKIVAVADVTDALLTKNRPYKEAWTPGEMVSYMRDNVNKQFEAEYVDALVESIDEIIALYEHPENHNYNAGGY
jgi:putative two-component system response regulator